MSLVVSILIPFYSNAGTNHTNMNFSFNLGTTNFTQYSPKRMKFEKTPVYCKVKSMHLNDQSIKLAAVRGDYTESTFTPIYYVTSPGVYYLSSNIMENHIKLKTDQNARIRCQKYNNFTQASLNGVRSPDSYR